MDISEELANTEREISQAETNASRKDEEPDGKEESHDSVKLSVADAKYALNIKELAMAITLGIHAWDGDQIENLVALAEEIQAQTGIIPTPTE